MLLIVFFDYGRRMKNLPTLRQLRFLVAVIERRHFSAAAEDCNVSQSTLSAAILELEATLGVKLLERTKRMVMPTAIGFDLAEKARLLLQSAEELVGTAEAARDPASGPLQLGVIPTIGPFIAPKIMPWMHRTHPDLKVFLREEQTAPLLARLDSGRLDAAIIALPFPCEGLETVDLIEDRFFVVCPSGSRLSRFDAIRPENLAGEELLLLEDGHCMRDHAMAACSLEGARRNSGFQGTSLHTLVQMAANGLGVTIAPAMAIEAGLLRGLDLKAIPMREDAPARRIVMAWRLTSSRKPFFRELAASLREALAAPSDSATRFKTGTSSADSGPPSNWA
jgi:LysR family hydrogen peroxide-inducible transcriptional activator